MDTSQMIKRFLPEGIYSIIAMIYLILLDRLNTRLSLEHFESDIELLLYDNRIAIKFFIFAIILFCVGIWLCSRNVKYGLRYQYDVKETIGCIIALVVIANLLLFTIYLISVPILRAIIIVVAIASGIVTSR